MTHNELWLTYHQVSRCDKPVTAQLIELEFQNHRLEDLAAVMDHLFSQGFVDAKYRPCSFWENHEGHSIGNAHSVEELLKNGAGRCPQTALRLVIQDSIPAVWFSYNYLHKVAAHAVTQRIRLDAPDTQFQLMAQLTNHIFARGYLGSNLRSKVFWQTACGRRVEEHERVQDLLEANVGVCERTCLKLMIDQVPVVSCPRSPTKCPAGF